MNLPALLPLTAAIASLALAVASLARKKPSAATWCFFAGMVVLATDSFFASLSLNAAQPPDVLRWQTLALVAKSLALIPWLGFSLTYSRDDFRESSGGWKATMALVAFAAIGLSVGFRGQLLELAQAGTAGEMLLVRSGTAAKALNVALLVGFVLVLVNLEQTLRAAVGTARWRIKYVVLGLAVIFGAHLYVRSQAILFSVYDASLSAVESAGLLVGCVLLVRAYARGGFAEVQVYPSRAVLRSSLTVLIVGGYLFVVGILAQLVRHFGGAESFQLQVVVVLLGISGLALLLLSERFRQRLHAFVARHFLRSQHDSVRIWTEFSQRLTGVKDQAGLCDASARFASETFGAMSVTVWLLDEKKRLLATASTAHGATTRDASAGAAPPAALDDVTVALRSKSAPFDLDKVNEPWAQQLRQANPAAFMTGGHRWVAPLRADEQALGALVLADRVNGARYSVEELDLLQCIAGQMTSALLNLRLGDEVGRARELEAFRSMSAFFVHDLKNAAASLNLMLKNLPVHFDDPAFREDALRAVGNTARRIDEMIERLSALRQRPELRLAEADLNDLVAESLGSLNLPPHVELERHLQPLPTIEVDREQIRSVVNNLLLNARDAVGAEGRIDVQTADGGGRRAVLSIADNGCGMSPAFMKDSLFRPFQSTKKKGLGIGMYQSRMIVEAHGGTIDVETEPGKGTTVRVSLPVKSAK